MLQLSGERIKGQRFLVLDLLGHLDVRWDPLQETIEKEVRSAAIPHERERCTSAPMARVGLAKKANHSE